MIIIIINILGAIKDLGNLPKFVIDDDNDNKITYPQ